MKKMITSRFSLLFFAVSGLIIATTSSCSKDDMKNVNKSIYFEVNLLQGKSAINYGPHPFGKRPESIHEAGLGSDEIINANGEIYTVITLSVSPESYYPESIKLGPITAFIKLMKPRKGVEGVYKKIYADTSLNIFAPLRIGIPQGDYWFFEEGDVIVTVQKTGASDISGAYAEGSYTGKGINTNNRTDSVQLSGNFRLYLD